MTQSRLRRSELSTPGHSTKMIAKAAGSEADLVFLDLEDSVVAAQKVAARSNIIDGLNDLDWGSKTRAVRINPVSTQWCHGDVVDIVSAAGHNLDVIIIPKVLAPRDVWFVDDLLTQLETWHGLEVGGIGIEVLIEETEALARVEEIAGSSDRLEALILGVGDLSASQGIRLGHIGAAAEGDYGYPGDVWHYARNRVTVAARAHGLDAIDGPFGAITNPDGYRREASWAATLGAAGKWAIHPSQISIANDVFAPTTAEIERATAAVEAVREAEAAGLGAASFQGMMIDAATARIFEAVLVRARQCGVLA
ncbi:HpcH/HpaI aldolase/citrate lyase family protein [Microbacterium trichothecenolyticum]|uniref:Malyl-CoA lyase n=1 Tax=Microbacterium trichothecenolyticum TaxID=69370 RepID=A0A0M2HDN4_MICTR|nr:CoA ester lyase [Microbacterium trichothecenolyticum]KJL42341.1 Malyl-CoA lyase [Microbacterium trichothecenolyticum]